MKCRRSGILRALALLLLVGMIALWGRSYVDPMATAPSTAAMRRQLAQRMPQTRFDQVALADVIDFLRDVQGVRIEVDWSALDAAGLHRLTQFTMKLSTPRLGEALAQITATGNGGVYVTNENTIRISTRAGLSVGRGAELDAGYRLLHYLAYYELPRTPRPSIPPPQTPAWEIVRGGYRWTLSLHRGTMRLWHTPADPASVYQEGTAVGNAAGPDADALFDVAGFFARRGGSPFRSWVVGMPFWALAGIAAIVPVHWLATVIHRTRRRRMGLCLQCGYDLRASRDRCPECGEPMPDHVRPVAS